MKPEGKLTTAKTNRGPLFASSFEEFNVALLFSCVFEQAEKNVYLEERLQVLQQQNEDLKERIDKNVAVSRSVKFEPPVLISNH